ncbi:MAG: hypothetical protein MJ139_06190, partial [Limosilactobacillus sp.]|nr:hypothetical protein [Limosilactobacillus sp.]
MYKGKKLKTSLIGLTTVGIAVGLNHYSEQHAKADTNDSAVGTYQNQNQLQELPVSADDLIDQTV